METKNLKLKKLCVVMSALMLFSGVLKAGEYENIKNKMEIITKRIEDSVIQPTTENIVRAGNKEYEEWELQMNYIYKKFLSELEKVKYSKAKASLIESQKVWLKFRDADSKYNYYVDSGDGEGTIRSISAAGSLVKTTEERTLALARIYDNFVENNSNFKDEKATKKTYEDADSKLNKEYNKLINVLKKLKHKNSINALIISEREWDSYIKKEAAFRHYLFNNDKEAEKGTVYYDALTKFTNERYEYLKTGLDTLEGNF